VKNDGRGATELGKGRGLLLDASGLARGQSGHRHTEKKKREQGGFSILVLHSFN
jgi:hypothetical protein